VPERLSLCAACAVGVGRRERAVRGCGRWPWVYEGRARATGGWSTPAGMVAAARRT
jgi:hypothetical protein